ncbi:unnamed protein product, partial [Effrenium voratum]
MTSSAAESNGKSNHGTSWLDKLQMSATAPSRRNACLRSLRSAPVEWRSSLMLQLRLTVFVVSALTVTFALVLQLNRPAADLRELFIAMRLLAIVSMVIGVVLLWRETRPRVIEPCTLICAMLLVIGQLVATVDIDQKFRLGNAARTYSLVCFGALVMGWSPAYHAAFLVCVYTVECIVLLNLVFWDEGGAPQGISNELLTDFVTACLSFASGLMMNWMYLQLYLHQERRAQESKAFAKLLSLACDFVLPLHREHQAVCISQTRPELQAYVGWQIQSGELLKNIMSPDSFDHLDQRLTNLVPLQPLMVPVTLTAGYSLINAEMLLVGLQDVDANASSKYLVGVRVDHQEIVPPDAADSARPPIFKERLSPEAPSESEFGKSEAALTTRTGVIFSCSKPQDSWRQVMTLGLKEHWLLPGSSLSLAPHKLLGS